MIAGTSLGLSNAPIDPAERRLLFDTSWPLMLIIMTAAYVLTWFLGLLAIDLSTVLWTTFGLAFGHQALSRVLDYLAHSNGVQVLHLALNIAAITGLGVVWSMLGGLAAPAFVIFFAVPVVTLGLTARPAIQYGVTLYVILLSWYVALRESAELRLQVEFQGFVPAWDALFGTHERLFSGYGVVASGTAQMQFMIVFSFAMLGVATASAVVIALIRRLIERVRSESVSGERAASLAKSFLTQEGGLELILDRHSFRIIAVSPKLAMELGSTPESMIGRHYSAMLPFPADHPVCRLVEAGIAAELPQQILAAASGHKLVNFRLHPGTSGSHDFQRITLEDLQATDYAQIAVDAFADLCGVVDGGGRIRYLSPAVHKLLPVMRNQWRADLLPLPAGWWQIAPRKRHTRQVCIGRTTYQLQLCRRQYFSDGNDMEVTVFRLAPVAGP